MKTKEVVIFIILTAIVVGVIALIFYIKSNGNHDEQAIKCIAEKSKIIASKTCSACAYQNQILGDYLEYFELIYVDENPEILEQYHIDGVPTWIINEKKYPGVHNIAKLKEITGCD